MIGWLLEVLDNRAKLAKALPPTNGVHTPAKGGGKAKAEPKAKHVRTKY